MKMERYIGSSRVRALAIVAILLAMESFAIAWQPSTGSWGPFRWSLATALILIALLAVVHSFRTVFDLWMRVARMMHLVATSLLFGIVYLLIIPFFAVWTWWSDPLQLRRKGDAQTFWRPRRQTPTDWDSLQRMA